MSNPTVFEVDGVEYRAVDLAKMAGIGTKAMLTRYRNHPDWNLEKLTQPNMNPDVITVEHDGQRKTLKAWANELGAPYMTAHERWKKGVRDFERLFLPYHALRKKAPGIYLSEETRKWLEETRFAREGMPDEWEIACDLIGVSRLYSLALRRAMT